MRAVTALISSPRSPREPDRSDEGTTRSKSKGAGNSHKFCAVLPPLPANTDEIEPQNYKEAMTSNVRSKWNKAINAEFNSIKGLELGTKLMLQVNKRRFEIAGCLLLRENLMALLPSTKLDL